MAKELLIAIIGAGPGGVTCAAMLEKLGIKSVIIERSSFPRFTIGESLLPVSLDHFAEAGLLEPILEANFMSKPGSVFHNGEQKTHIVFSQTNNITHQRSLSLARDTFDLLLAQTVQKRGIEIKWETTLTNASFDGVWKLTLEKSGEETELLADFVVDASGVGVIARFVGVASSQKSPQKGGAIFAHLKDDRRPAGFEGGATWIVTNDTNVWAWIIPFSGNVTSVGFVGTVEQISEYGETDSERFSRLVDGFPLVKKRFRSNEKVREPVFASRYKREMQSPSGTGFCLLGNSIGFLDPILSSGVAVATESAIRSAYTIQKHFSVDGTDWEVEYNAPMRAGLKVFSDCVDAWYDGTLPSLVHNQPTGKNNEIHPTVRQINSILAGGAWDTSNPLTRDTARKLRFLSSLAKGLES